MGAPTSDSGLFNALAHEYAERCRHGEPPPLEEYTRRYPELAAEIRDLFPTLRMMEQLAHGEQSSEARVVAPPRRGVPVPERLGDFRILREIGRGGMGVVYEAVQESLGRHVALKVLAFGREVGQVQLKRFEREAKAAALLHHTNIVPVFGVGEHEGSHYYAMQYIQGQSLDTVLAEVIRLRRRAPEGTAVQHVEPENMAAGLASELLTDRQPPRTVPLASKPVAPLTEAEGSTPERGLLVGADSALPDNVSSNSSIVRRPETLYYRGVARAGMQAAEGLAHAHLHGVLHRDIKPANLLLDLQGTLWITDFGLAKATGNDELTSPGDVVGTLRYMAPERFRGKADPRSDIYSLGATLYEMLTLRPAFTASERAELMSMIVHQEPARLRSHDPRIPRDLETIVLKAISKRPSDRFSSAGELARELERFLAGRPIHSRRVSLPERMWRWSLRNPAQAVLALLAMALTSILAIGSTVAAWKFREQYKAVQVEERKTRAALGESLLVQAQATRHSRQAGRQKVALGSLHTAAAIAHEVGAQTKDLAKLRDEAIAALALIDDQMVENRQGFAVAPPGAAYTIDGDRYAILGSDGSIQVHRLSDRSLIRVVGSNRPMTRYEIRFVPGGRFACVTAGTLQTELWDLEQASVPAAWPSDVRGAAPRADGRQVAALESDGTLRVYDLPAMNQASCSRLAIALPERLDLAAISLAEDGRRIALISPDRTRACVYEVGSGRLVCELETPSVPPVRAIALSRDGRLLAVNHDRSISIHEVGNGAQLALLQGHHAIDTTFSFQPGGDLLASRSWDGTTRLWDPLRGRLLLTLGGHFLDWGESGSLVAILRDQNLTLHRLAPSDLRRTIDCRLVGNRATKASSFPFGAAYSADGQLIAMALDPGVVVVRASDGAELAFLPIGACDQVLFLPQGALLTNQVGGLTSWPIRRLEGGRLRMGPPEPLAVPDQGPEFNFTGLAASASGRLVGVTLPKMGGALLFDPDRPWRRTWLMPHNGAASLAISPDGRWAATTTRSGSTDGRQLKIWDAATGKLLVQHEVGVAKVAFSPDGRWLGVGGATWLGTGNVNRYRFFRTGSWTSGPQFDHGMENGLAPLAFHPCGSIAAIRDSYEWWMRGRSSVRLVDLESGRVLAALEAPDDANTYELKFSPDGRFLAAAQTDYRMNVWDLSRLRSHLQKLDLAMGLPDLFAGSAPSDAGGTVKQIDVAGIDDAGLRILAVRQTLRRAWFGFRRMIDSNFVDPHELYLRCEHWVRQGEWRLAAADFERALTVQAPDDPLLRFQQAVLCAAAGDMARYRSVCDHMRDLLGKTNDRSWLVFAAHAWIVAPGGPAAARQALQLAERRAAAIPMTWSDHVLGLARYRAGQFAEADTLLRASLDRNPGWDAQVLDWLVIAMAQKQLGNRDESRRWLERAEGWVATRLRGRPGGFDQIVPERWTWRDGILLHLLLREARALCGPD
jgi:serine/threonine protein kinase/WD40 repeat protein